MRSTLAIAPLLLVVVAWVGWCWWDIAHRRPRSLNRWAWAAIVALSVPLGGILWLAVGRARDDLSSLPPPPSNAPTPSRPTARAARVAPGTPPIVLTHTLEKRFDAQVALDGVDLVVPRGSVYGLVGPNGAGKTTLLALLAGLGRPSSGTIDLGIDRARVGVLADTPTFDPWLTAREVVDLARVLVDPALPAATVDEVLATSGLTAAADRRVGGFSRGMLQRLGIATTLVARPELLLLDEPCSALDPLGRREVLDLVAGLAGRATVLFCSHILDDVQEVCDTVGVLHQGRLLSQGPVSELLAGHASPAFVVRVRPPVEPIAEALRHRPWVHDVLVEGAEVLRVEVTDLDEAEAGLAPALADAGARITSITPAAGDLEDVVLALTREPAR